MNKKSILIADRNKLLLEALEEIFTLNGYQVMTADNGSSAFNLAKVDSPDLIVCDLLLPGMSGAELYGRLQTYPFTSNIPIIFFIAETTSAQMLRTQYGVSMKNIVYKPFSVEGLLDVAQTVLNESGYGQRCTAGSAF